MRAHPTLDQLNALGLYGLAKGFKDLEHKPEARGLDHAEWLGLLLEYETTLRRQKQFEARARAAKLRHGASVEDPVPPSSRSISTRSPPTAMSRATMLLSLWPPPSPTPPRSTASSNATAAAASSSATLRLCSGRTGRMQNHLMRPRRYSQPGSTRPPQNPTPSTRRARRRKSAPSST
ncbi:MAG: IstB-like ATP-binding domain-containing protein [Pseudomonadota bacterium]|nr:IstB-like ATP-binding domain-containing protein [Pseudomonadota bacterium]